MRRWWRQALGVSRGALGLALVAGCVALVACGGSSKTNGSPSSGSSGEAGRGGGAGTAGGAQGGSSGDAASGGAGTGGVGDGNAGEGASGRGVGGVGAAASGGTSGSSAGGAAGDDASTAGESSAGESSAGAGGDCEGWCTAQTPACCGLELQCGVTPPACRLDVLADTVDVIVEYADLEEEIRGLSSAIELTVPLGFVERAAVDVAPAARFELTLGAQASAELAALAGMYLHPFRVSCDEQELFVGVVYMMEGAAAIRTPVLHVKDESGVLVLRIAAWQGAWLLGTGEPGAHIELRERIDRAELRASFCERGILGEL